MRVLVVTSAFYTDIAEMLEAGAIAALQAENALYTVMRVPGAFEIPAIIARAAGSGEFNAYVALGCVIRGETGHYDYVCGESARGLMDLSVQLGLAIGYGILTVENHDQAVRRADPTQGNRARDAVEAALCVARAFA
ncbi:MAG: 6,7-dimethyl-8-ribityllumazine synthase [Alphaproteobacteria bacterium]|nr:6,7-dimethyl-8-ribityllumazine synthase [Alphaproteobacteria bacterium]